MPALVQPVLQPELGLHIMPRDHSEGNKLSEQQWERWNTHFSTCVDLELFGWGISELCEPGAIAPSDLADLSCCRHQWALAQDPNSQHLGSTVWDASIVFAKYLEQVSGSAAMLC